MENRQIAITAKNNNSVKLGVIPGHFATNHSHVNYFVDMTTIKTQYRAAREAALFQHLDALRDNVQRNQHNSLL